MKKRSKVNASSDKKKFTRTALQTSKKNIRGTSPRGGYRL